MRAAGVLTRFYQRSGLEYAVRTFGLTMFLPATLRRLEPQTPRMAAAFSNRLIAPSESPRGEARYRVALLTGCIQDLVFSDVNRDTADVLLANGCAVDTPSPQPCCGSLHAHNGELDLAREQARRMIDLFRRTATMPSSPMPAAADRICAITATCSNPIPATAIGRGRGIRS